MTYLSVPLPQFKNCVSARVCMCEKETPKERESKRERARATASISTSFVLSSVNCTCWVLSIFCVCCSATRERSEQLGDKSFPKRSEKIVPCSLQCMSGTKARKIRWHKLFPCANFRNVVMQFCCLFDSSSSDLYRVIPGHGNHVLDPASVFVHTH